MTNEEVITRLISINNRLLDAKLKLKRSRRRPSEKAMMAVSIDGDMRAVGIAVATLKAIQVKRVTDDAEALATALAFAQLKK